MKRHYIFSALTALVAAKTHIDFSPTCSVQMTSCLNIGMLKAGCKLSSLRCACINQRAIKGDMIPCIESACSADEFAYFLNLDTNDHCEDFDASFNAASESASAALFHGQWLNVSYIAKPVAASPTDEPAFTGTVIVSPNDPTTPCNGGMPTSTGTPTITTDNPPYSTPPPSGLLPPANATSPSPTLPVFTDAAGSVKVGGVAVGLAVLGVML